MRNLIAAVIDIHITSAMPSVDTTFSPDEAHYREPLRRVYLLEDMALEIHSHNVTKRCVVDSIGVDNRIVPKWGSVMRTTRCRWKLHISPLFGDRMPDEFSTCYPARDKKGRKGIKHHSHIRSVSRESSAIQQVFCSLSIDFVHQIACA